MDIGKIIRFKRRESALTQEELSSGICSITYLSKLENGKLDSQVNKETLNLLLVKLGISDQELLSDDQGLIEKLFLWYEKICDNDLRESTNMYNELWKRLENIENYEVLIYFKLFTLRFYLEVKDLDNFISLKKNLEKKEELFSPEHFYYFYKFIGYLYMEKDTLIKAEHYLIKSYKLGQELKINEPDLLYSLGKLMSRLGKYLKSFLYLQKAETKYSELMDYEQLFKVNTIISINYLLVEEYELSIEKIKMLLSQAKKIDEDKLTIAMLKHNLGYAYFKSKQYQQAHTYFYEVLALKKLELGDSLSRDYLITYYLYAQSLIQMNEDNTNVISVIEKGCKISEELNDKEYLLKFTYLSYKFYPDYTLDETINFLVDVVIEYFKNKGDRDDYKLYLLETAYLYKEKSLYKKSTEYLLNYINS